MPVHTYGEDIISHIHSACMLFTRLFICRDKFSTTRWGYYLSHREQKFILFLLKNYVFWDFVIII